MARIIRFSREPHDDVQLLLPWYVTGRLEEADVAQVERHLADCAECQAEFAAERRLQAAVADIPLGAEASWAELRRRIAAPSPVDRLRAALGSGWRALADGGWRWALAGQAVAALALVAVVAPPRVGQETGAAAGQGVQPAYHTLSAPKPAPAATAGDAVVVFRPDARVEDVARALRASGARLVDGPTAADAYVLTLGVADRRASLARLRADPAIALAEPLDPAGLR